MSHATCLVSLSEAEIESAGGIKEAVDHQMMPFDEGGDWFADGSRWDLYQIGGRYTGRLIGKDVVTREELRIETLETFAEKRARKLWANWKAEKRKDDFIRSYVYGLEPDSTLESIIVQYKATPLTAFAFLQDRTWRERGRLGWFGGIAKTECSIAAEENGAEYKGRCIHTQEELGAKIITYEEDDKRWDKYFFPRFILKLPPEQVLVMVDYHV